jgi:hypothetical protein
MAVGWARQASGMDEHLNAESGDVLLTVGTTKWNILSLRSRRRL